MNHKDMIGKAKQLFAEAKTIYENPEMTAEEFAQAEKMIVDARQLKTRGAKIMEIEVSATELQETVEEKKREFAAAPPAMRMRQVGTEFKSIGEMLTAVKALAKFNRTDERLHWFDEETGKITEVKDILEQTGATGGFLVPPEYIAELLAVQQEASYFRQRATIIPMRRRQVNLPVLDQTNTTAGQPCWFGGMQFVWAEEAASKTQSDPEFRLIELVAHKLIGYTRASDEIMADSAISLEAFLTGPMGFVGGANWMEEFAFIQGTGVGMPLGIIPAGATITVPRAADGAIGYPDLCDMVENFLPSGRGIWIITQSALSDLLQLNGPAGNPSYIWGNAITGAPGVLLGMPVIWTEKCPRIGTEGDVILADLSYYLIGDRQAVTVESTQFDRWRFDETSWRMVSRVDGQPWLSQPLTLQDGSSQISPFVILGSKES